MWARVNEARAGFARMIDSRLAKYSPMYIYLSGWDFLGMLRTDHVMRNAIFDGVGDLELRVG